MGGFTTLFVGFVLGAACVVALLVRMAKGRRPKAPVPPDATQARLAAALQALDAIARNGDGPLVAIAKRALARDAALRTPFER